MKRGTVVTDKYHNQISMRTMVKPIDPQSPFFGVQGEVKGIHKDTLFLLYRKADNLHLLRSSNGFYAIKAHQVINSGYNLIDNANKMNQYNTLEVVQSKLDRRIKDVKAINQVVFVTRGPLKGYKGVVIYADEV